MFGCLQATYAHDSQLVILIDELGHNMSLL